MAGIFRRSISVVFLAVCPASLFGVAAAQSLKLPSAAPIPARILSAKRVFIANGGADERSTTDPQYKGGPDRAYNGFYAALKAGGHYELATDPSESDLVLEVSFMMELPVKKGGALTSSDYDPEFRLSIRDPRSNVLLWSIIEHAQWALLRGNRDRNFDEAIVRVVSDFQALTAGSSPAGASSGD